jgi:hypothetical protein
MKEEEDVSRRRILTVAKKAIRRVKALETRHNCQITQGDTIKIQLDRIEARVSARPNLLP